MMSPICRYAAFTYALLGEDFMKINNSSSQIQSFTLFVRIKCFIYNLKHKQRWFVLCLNSNKGGPEKRKRNREKRGYSHICDYTYLRDHQYSRKRSPRALKTNLSWPARIRWRVTPGAVLQSWNNFLFAMVWGSVDSFDLFPCLCSWIVLIQTGNRLFQITWICHCQSVIGYL